MSQDWTKAEVEMLVADYFAMLQLELQGLKYNKSEHRNALLESLPGRGPGSIEFKHQNVSAALIDMHKPWIEGYKPMPNYQRSLLPAVIEAYLQAHPEMERLFAQDVAAEVEVPEVEDILEAFDSPPGTGETGQIREEPPAWLPPAGAVDYLEREALNQSLGAAGEVFVMRYEQARLIHAGRESLAGRIERVSESVGPAAGYDIHSYDESGQDRFIEAKTTRYGKNTPFFISPNELRFSERNATRYFLYRVFSFRRKPRLFWLSGNVRAHCVLEPSGFIARV